MPGARVHHTEKDAMQRGLHFKTVVRAKMVALGLLSEEGHPTDKVLSAKSHVSENTIRNLWQGHGAEIGTLMGIANAVDMSILDILLAMQGRPVQTEAGPLESIVTELRGIRETLALAGGSAQVSQDALGALDVEQEDRAAEPADDPIDEPASSSRRGRSDEGTPPG